MLCRGLIDETIMLECKQISEPRRRATYHCRLVMARELNPNLYSSNSPFKSVALLKLAVTGWPVTTYILVQQNLTWPNTHGRQGHKVNETGIGPSLIETRISNSPICPLNVSGYQPAGRWQMRLRLVGLILQWFGVYTLITQTKIYRSLKKS